MRKHPLLIGTAEAHHGFFRNFPLQEETLTVVSLHQVPNRLRSRQWDLLLLDCGEDPRAGLALLQEIKPAYPGLPILVMLEPDSVETAISAFRLGAKDCITKPFAVLDLQARLETLLRLKRSYSGARQFVAAGGHQPPGLRTVPSHHDVPLNIIKTLHYMESNLAAPLTLTQLAREACLSRYHFCRTFGKVMTMTPMKYLNYLRVQKSKQLLGRNGLNLSAVAMQVGFGNLNNMNKWFKIFEGTSPSHYRFLSGTDTP
jgi:AraC-like DNA-binding protein/CheY-like chemotaxis protein